MPSTSLASTVHIRLKINGRVQGVGFRPFVCQLAQRLNLLGSVANSNEGVIIHLQGAQSAIEVFQRQLQDEMPPQAFVHSMTTVALTPVKLERFTIIDSESCGQAASVQVAADIAMCSNCLAEFHDRHNRRYHDPFINCSDCGPRYSILKALPYDRAHSAMNRYEMCQSCRAEYKDINQRRFHTQGICCPECGPKVRLFDGQGQLVDKGESAIQKVAEILKSKPGGLVAFKATGGFHLLCNATDSAAIQSLRKRKRRPSKPFALLCKDLAMANNITEINTHEAELLNSSAAPIVLLKKSENEILSPLVAPDLDKLGVFLANSPLQHLLFEFIDEPLVATSANLSGEPIIYSEQAVFDKLCQPNSPIVDWVLSYDRDIVNPCDDSIVQSVEEHTVTLRLSRGYAPLFGDLSFSGKARKPDGNQQAIMAVGAQQKSALAMSLAQQWMLSPYIGDLNTLASQQRFQQNIERFQAFYPQAIQKWVVDWHPDYFSSQWVQSRVQQEVVPVQHHYAHILACMAEYHMTQSVLGFAWDGTGLGEHGDIWGSETFLADTKSYQHVLSLCPFKLLGGDKANQQPYRVVLSLLFELMDLDEVLALKSSQEWRCLDLSEEEITRFYRLYQSDVNCPPSSSMGRLFDAVACLLGLVMTSDYEGQSGLLLEALYNPDVKEAYNIEIQGNQIQWQMLIQQLMSDKREAIDTSIMVSRFYNFLVELVIQQSDLYPSLPVVLSGGVFQNKTLLALLIQRFSDRDQPLCFQQQTPINDGAIALGQLWYAINNTND